MTMSDTIMVISIIAGLGISLTSIGLLATALAPGWVRRSTARLQAAPVSTSLAGLFVGGLAYLVDFALLAQPHPAVKFAALIGLLGLLSLSFTGAAGLARLIGSRLPSPADADRPWKAVVRGWAVLYLASILPILGWFVILPAALLAGFGAALTGVLAARPAEASPALAKNEAVA